jgi:hypothetical protein
MVDDLAAVVLYNGINGVLTNTLPELIGSTSIQLRPRTLRAAGRQGLWLGRTGSFELCALFGNGVRPFLD